MLHTCFLMTILFYMHSVHFDWIFFHIWCSLGHGRKFIKNAPSACRINGHINHFDMKLVMFLINAEKKPRLLFWCIFFLKFCLKKVKTALRIAFSWIVKKKKKKNAFRIAIFRPATGNRLVFFFGLRGKKSSCKKFSWKKVLSSKKKDFVQKVCNSLHPWDWLSNSLFKVALWTKSVADVPYSLRVNF